jgi:prepilin-type N-terminal cleavage/methylation domain-containing protein
MFSVIQNAVRWHRDARHDDDAGSADDRTEGGFSLIELLVVVIIIGILAAIAIPIYVGVQNTARDSQVKSDLVNAKHQMVIAYQETGSFPATIADLKTAGFSPSAQTTDGYTVNWQMFNVSTSGFCIRAWADTPGDAADLWIDGTSGVVGPIPVGDYAHRPAGCPHSAV